MGGGEDKEPTTSYRPNGAGVFYGDSYRAIIFEQ